MEIQKAAWILVLLAGVGAAAKSVILPGSKHGLYFDDPDTAVDYINAYREQIDTKGFLGFLRSHPQFELMRSIFRDNRQIFNAVLQQIGQTNPVLLKVILENEEEFMRWMNEGGPSTTESPQDREAIERLKSLGFPEDEVIQAYFAFDKNETLAANYLRGLDS